MKWNPLPDHQYNSGEASVMATEVYRCIHCGAEIEPNRKRCRECGRGLEEVALSSPELPGRVAQWPLLLILLFGLGSILWGIRHAMRSLSAPRAAGPDHYQAVAPSSPEPNPLPEPAPGEPTPPRKTEPAADATPRQGFPTGSERREEPTPEEPNEQARVGPLTGNDAPPTLPLAAPPQQAVPDQHVAPPREAAEISRPALPQPPPPVLPSIARLAAGTTAVIPAQGIVLWSGGLKKNEEVLIDGTQVNRGTLTGALPGVPVLVNLDSQDFGFAEMPGPSNGWKRIVLRSRVNRNSVVTIRWTLLR